MTMTKLQSFWGKVLATTVLAGVVVMRADALAPQPGTAMLLAAGLMGASGSTVGPDRALYVTEGILGRISRIDPETGVVTPFASGLPPSIVGIGGAIDLAFVGNTAYVLVTLVGSDVGGSSVVGLYRVDGPVGTTPVADIGAFAIANPPTTAFDVPTGLQFALDNYRNGFLVTDGHHNRVLRVERDGQISVFRQFGNIVPTGLAVVGAQVFMAEAGPVPHLAQDGRVVLMRPPFASTIEIAAGAPLLVDVEFGRGNTPYALSQGDFPAGAPPAAPALPNTGALLRVGWDGTLTEVVTGLNVPTSVEFIDSQAFVVTLGGEVWKITFP
jgi:sugar lactone lactonase YvrE